MPKCTPLGVSCQHFAEADPQGIRNLSPDNSYIMFVDKGQSPSVVRAKMYSLGVSCQHFAEAGLQGNMNYYDTLKVEYTGAKAS